MERQSSKSRKSELIDRLISSRRDRESYLRSTLNTLIPSQIKALRLREPWTQKELGEAAGMLQARVSASEKPGAVAFALETLIRYAAAFKVGLQVRFVPLSEMLEWENSYSQDKFKVTKIEDDDAFIEQDDDAAEQLTHTVNSVQSIAAIGAPSTASMSPSYLAHYAGNRAASAKPNIEMVAANGR
jgi:transcriptional regulator with XRE-family HTH domain